MLAESCRDQLDHQVSEVEDVASLASAALEPKPP